MREDNYNYSYEYIKSHFDEGKNHTNEENHSYPYNSYLSEKGNDYNIEEVGLFYNHDDKDYDVLHNNNDSSKTK